MLKKLKKVIFSINSKKYFLLNFRFFDFFCTFVKIFLMLSLIDQLVSYYKKLIKPFDFPIYFQHLAASCKVLWAKKVMDEKKGTHIFITLDEKQALNFVNDLQSFGQKNVLFFPNFSSQLKEQNTDLQTRTEVLLNLSKNLQNTILVGEISAFLPEIAFPNVEENWSIFLKVGEDYQREYLEETWINQHFQEVNTVKEPGQFSIRGSIIDIFSFSHEHPVRIEFLGSQIASLRFFEVVSQRSIQKIKEVEILPNLDLCLKNEEKNNFFDSLDSKNTTLWFWDYRQFYRNYTQFFQENYPEKNHLKNPENLEEKIKFFNLVEWTSPAFFAQKNIVFEVQDQPSFQGNFLALKNHLKEYQTQNYQLFFTAKNPNQADRLEILFKESEISYQLLRIDISEGFIDHQNKIICYTDHQIFERYHRIERKNTHTRKALQLKELFELEKGDFVTHLDHGIGQFSGLITQEKEGKKQEFIKLLYKNSDVLLVPIHALHKISRFAGKDADPTLHQLGSTQWALAKEKAKKKIKTLAFNLLELYAKRKMSKGFAFSPDSDLQQNLEASFMYEDTPDQCKATQEVKKDMESSRPMDRLICGDVGFGKTEIAIRAAFKAAYEGKQVAVLVPTTVLCLQHFRSFSQRLKNFPVKVEWLNRFRSSNQTKIIKEELKNGKIDIIIGTHQLVGESVKFKDLGLLIIDEEQKFGVSVKDKLKNLRVNVDTLTLTATPIPRTLQFSLMGSRDLSILQTPPKNRRPIETQILTFNEAQLKIALEKELDRGGQIYFIHNSVQTLTKIENLLKKLVPKMRITVGHGQMEGKLLEERILAFMEGEYDLLLATTIVENGIDVPNAHSIFINNAQNFGLSDLHQMRGRVGRSQTQAFCYLLIPSFREISSQARERLDTLAYFSDLGSGFHIAMKDLDLRGAGTLLGGEQSGFISDIGFEVYQKILNQTVQELKSQEFKEFFEAQPIVTSDCVLETDLELRIPETYVASAAERLHLYQQLANCKTDQEIDIFVEQLTDRFGSLPLVTQDLMDSVRLQKMAQNLGFEKIILKNQRLIGQLNAEKEFLKSQYFARILDFLQHHREQNVELKEKDQKPRIIISSIKNMSQAIKMFKKI